MTLEITKTAARAKSSHTWPPSQGEWTYADYARLPENGFRYEVIEGELFMSPAPRPNHQRVGLRLIVLLDAFVEKNQLGELYHAPIDLNLPDLTSPVQPDILFISTENLDIVKEKTIEGVPDLIIEVLSPGSIRYDRQTKFQIYAKAGVREYWIVDPYPCAIDVFVLRGQAYVPLGSFKSADQLRSEQFADLTFQVQELCR